MSPENRLELSIGNAPMPELGPVYVLIRVEARYMISSARAALLAGANIQVAVRGPRSRQQIKKSQRNPGCHEASLRIVAVPRPLTMMFPLNTKS